MSISDEPSKTRPEPPEMFYDHNGPENVADRPAAHRAIAAKCPVIHSPAYDGYYVAVGYDEVAGVLRRAEVFSSRGDYALRGGKKIFVSLGAANRDPAKFARPDVIDIERNAKRHLGFGIGPHRCLGSHIARVWWEEMVGAVLDRLPDYVIDDDGVQVYPTGAISGLATMPVTFTPEE